MFDRITKWPQCLHILALVIYVYAFSVVIYLWGSTMSFEKKFVYPYYAGVTVVTLNCIVGVICILCVCKYLNYHYYYYHDIL